MSQRKESDHIRCPLEYGLKIFGSRWNARIICVLSAKEVLRYSELRKQIGNITDAVVRKSYDEVPPRVEYSLSEKGASVVPIIQSICKWSGIFYKKDKENISVHCQRCDYHE